MTSSITEMIYRLLLDTLFSLTNAHAVRGRPTLKEDERFRNGSVHELKELQINTNELQNNINMNIMNSNKNSSENCIAMHSVLHNTKPDELKFDDKKQTDILKKGENFKAAMIESYELHKASTESILQDCQQQLTIVETKSNVRIQANLCSENVHDDSSINEINEFRSRRAMFVSCIEKTVPASSQIHHIVNNIRIAPRDCYRPIPSTIKRQSFRKITYRSIHIVSKRRKKKALQRVLKEPNLQSMGFIDENCSSKSTTYKSLNHRRNFCQSALRTDIEKNPGPTLLIDPNKTIRAPYSQGNILVFGRNAGQQCVAMSLCSLIYNKRQPTTSQSDLVQIMNIGNELYTSLSQSAGQSFLMMTELPTMLTVYDTDYQFEYSESYTGNVHGDRAINIEGYTYCMPIDRAFECLLRENYTSFILTIGSIAVQNRTMTTN